MKKLLQTTKNNWLFYVGVISIPLFITLSILIPENEDFISSRYAMLEGNSLTLFAFGVLLVAPILEELSFRGFFTNKKRFVIIGSILLSGFIYLVANNYFGWISLVFFYSLFYLNYKAPSKWTNLLLIITSSLLFALIHYKYNDFQSISTYIGIMYLISLSLIAVWVTQNFGLAKSMLLHAVNNSIVVLILILAVQFPDTTKQTYEDNNMKVTWNRVPRFTGFDGSYSYNDGKIVATNCSPSLLYLGLKSKDSIDIPNEPFMNYNFTVMAKNKNIDLIENPKILKDFLIKKELIFLMKKE